MEAGRAFAAHHGREAVLTLEIAGAALPQAEVYAEVAFEGDGI